MPDFNLTKTDWDQALAAYLPNDYQTWALDFLNQIYQNEQSPVYPSRDHVFRAFMATPLVDTKVVILGQDPYHEPGQGQGLAFSVPETLPAPPSLKNILRELADDLGRTRDHHDLENWTHQGVLLLNAVLTVAKGQANSHQNQGWEALSDAAIQAASATGQAKVFILWGKAAQKKADLVDTDRHLILQAPHPSPLSAYRGFFGSKPFTKANDFLKEEGEGTIDWLR